MEEKEKQEPEEKLLPRGPVGESIVSQEEKDEHSRLTPRGQTLLKLVSEIFESTGVETGSILDEVSIVVDSDKLLEVCGTLRENPALRFDFLRCLSVVDYQDSFQVVYHLWSMDHRYKLVLKTNTGYEEPKVPSIVSIWPSADWFEREGRDLFGVDFEGHPGLKPLLLWEGFEGFPGRKSFPFHEYEEW
jgi:NADH-quinone oxidoreductase subunit C